MWEVKWNKSGATCYGGGQKQYYVTINAIFCTVCHLKWNLHTQISSGDSVLSTTFCGDHIMDTTFLFHDHYDITIGNDDAEDDHCDIIMGVDIAMGTYHNVTMHTDVVMTLTYYVLTSSIVLFLFAL